MKMGVLRITVLFTHGSSGVPVAINSRNIRRGLR
jgi:hypothetical protein